MFFGDEIRPHHFDVEAKCPTHRKRVAQPIHFVLRVGQPERAAAMPCHGLAGLFFKRLGIEADIVIDHFSQPVGTGRMGDLTCCMPGRAAGQFCFLQQYGVGAPTFVAKVIGQATAHDAAADDDDLGTGGKSFSGHRLVSCSIATVCSVG